jgi:hypothetical protein
MTVVHIRASDAVQPVAPGRRSHPFAGFHLHDPGANRIDIFRQSFDAGQSE